MLIFFFLSTILFFPEGKINDWLKHIPFYIGQFLFYLWLESIFGKTNSQSQSQTKVVAQAATLPAAGGLAEWLNFLTDQGLQHIITLPFSILIIAIIKVRFDYIPTHLKSTLNILILAVLSLTMIHVGEFVVESQAWLPFLESSIEVIEFLWYYLALGLFAFGVKKLAQTPV